MAFLASPPAPVTGPILSLKTAPSVQVASNQWLSLGWSATIANAQLIYRIVVTDGSGNKLYISPWLMVISDPVATDGAFLASGTTGEDGAFKIPASGALAYVLVQSLNPPNPTPTAPVVTWTVAGSTD